MPQPTIHRSTVIVSLFMLALILFLNAPGENLSPLSIFDDATGALSIYRLEYLHGWPWIHLSRTVDYVMSMPNPPTIPDTPKYGVAWLASTNWEFWQGDPWKLRYGALLANLAAGMFLILAVAAAWEWRRRRRVRLVQFTLAELAIVMTIVAGVFGWLWSAKAEYERELELTEQLEISDSCDEMRYRGPLWLKRILGEEILSPMFERIDAFTLVGQRSHETVPALLGLHYLRKLQLIKVYLGSEIPCSQLANLKSLRSIVLKGLILTQQDVSELAKLRQIEEIVVVNWAAQCPEILQQLSDILPQCRVHDELEE
jgi:hypothetical protein